MLYLFFLLINAAEMLWETYISVRNSRRLLEKGAVDVGSQILPVMIILYLFLFIGSFIEYLNVPRSIPLWWTLLFVGLYLLAKALKFWAIVTLGPFWTMKVLIIPGSKVVTTGPYRWIKHPNYVAVLTEIAATALAGKCFYTFATVFALFSLTLYYRIKNEEKALLRLTDYSQNMRDKRRFLP